MSESTVTLADLCGLRMLDGRGEFVAESEYASDSALVIVLRLDGQCFRFQEDPDDGYRSCLGTIRLCSEFEIPPGAFISFAPIVVSLRLRTEPASEYSRRDEVLYGVDERTSLVIFEIGTEDLDDYYPSFVHSWTPDGVAPRWMAAS